MSMIKTFGALAVAATLLTGCLSGGGGGNSGSGGIVGGVNNGGDNGAEAPVVSVSFTTLVKDILAATSGTAEPVAINGLDITFDDQQNEGAFDDLLSQ